MDHLLREQEQHSLELDAMVERYAEYIVEKRLETPALFFLELHLPVTTVVHTGVLLFEPLAGPLFGSERVASLRALLAERSNIERLIKAIEHKSESHTKH